MATEEQAARQELEKRRVLEKRWFRFAGIAILVIVLAAFIIDNSQSVRIGFLIGERTTPLFWVLFVTAIAGAVIDRLVRWRRS